MNRRLEEALRIHAEFGGGLVGGWLGYHIINAG